MLKNTAVAILGCALLVGCQSTSPEKTVKDGTYRTWDDNGDLSTVQEYSNGVLVKDLTYWNGVKRLERIFNPITSKLSQQTVYAAEEPHLLRTEEYFDSDGSMTERFRVLPNKVVPIGLHYNAKTGHVYYSITIKDGSKSIQRLPLPNAHRVNDHVLTGFGVPETSQPAYSYHDDYKSSIELVYFKPDSTLGVKIGYSRTEEETCDVSDTRIDLKAKINGTDVELMGRCSKGEGQSYIELYPASKESQDEIISALIFSEKKYVELNLLSSTIPFDRENFSNYFKAANWSYAN